MQTELNRRHLVRLMRRNSDRFRGETDIEPNL